MLRRRKPTARVDEDCDRAVISVLVSQSDDDAGSRAGQGISVGSNGVRGTLHTYTTKTIHCNYRHRKEQWRSQRRRFVYQHYSLI